jgi:catechol 2,3-dioxygenase-like lactoylglutathione lyase family enzyme
MKSQSKPKRPGSLIQGGIAHVGLKVSDVEKSSRFYSEVLGLKSKLRRPGVAHVLVGKDLLVLYDRIHGKSEFHFGFTVQSSRHVDAWKEWLRINKVAVQEDNEHDYKSIKLKDPNGHWIEISEER